MPQTKTISNDVALALYEERRRREAAADLDLYCRYIEIPGAPLNDEESCPDFYVDTVTPAEHHTLLNAKLQDVNDGKIKRLMVFMPPGSAKSTYASVTFPTFWMGNHPNEPVILASYGSSLADKFGRKCRQIADSKQYRELFRCGLRANNRAANDWSLTNNSTFMCGGILSGLTGNRARLIVIDDPVQGREQADSAVVREKTWEAYRNDLRTRLKPDGAIVIIQTRWHEDDLSGRILPDNWDGESGTIKAKDGEEWYVLCLEAECTRDDDPLGRVPGEYLWTDWFTVAHWSTEKHVQGSRNWGALFQQRPRPQQGSLIHRNWLRRYTTPPAEFLRIVQSWDTAYKDKEINDPSVCTTWGETRQGFYLLDVFRDRMVYPDVRRAIVSQALRWTPTAVLIEDKASGQSLIQELRQGVDVGGETFTPPVIAMDPKGINKIDRLVAESSKFESGMVYLPEHAPWLLDYEMELFGFPIAANDDQVDSTSQYLKWASASRVLVDYHSTGHQWAGLQQEEVTDTGDDYDIGINSSNDSSGFM
jgi:predicted phage terminase large subunit-like protein